MNKHKFELLIVVILSIIPFQECFASSGPSKKRVSLAAATGSSKKPKSNKNPSQSTYSLLLHSDISGKPRAPLKIDFSSVDLVTGKDIEDLIAAQARKGLPWVAAKVRVRIGNKIEEVEEYTDGLQWHKRLKADRRSGYYPEHPVYLHPVNSTSYTLIQKVNGRFIAEYIGTDEEAAFPTFRGRLLRALLDPTQTADTWCEIALSYHDLQNIVHAEEWADKALQSLLHAGNILSEDEKISIITDKIYYGETYESTLLGLGHIYLKAAKSGRAQELFDKMLEYLQNREQPIASALNRIGYAYELSEHCHQACLYYLQAIRCDKSCVHALANILYLFATQQKSAVADETKKNVAQKLLTSVGLDHPDLIAYGQRYSARYEVVLDEIKRLSPVDR